MGRLSLQLFGGLSACSEGRADIAPVGRKALALLAYLALNPGQRCTRDRLAALLWSDRGEDQARQSLRQAVRSLHKALDGDGAAILVSEGDRLALDPDAVAVDVRAFERLSASHRREDLEQARTLYAGDFLDGIDLRSEGFEEWLGAERGRLRDLAADVLQRLARIYADSGDWDAALDAGQQLLRLDPLREEGHRILMRLYESSGRRALALRQFRICEETLRRELAVAPAPETIRLCSEIRARAGATAQGAAARNGIAGEEPQRATLPADDTAAARSTGVDGGNPRTEIAVAESGTAPPTPAARRSRRWIYAAAAVVVIAAIGLGVWHTSFAPTPPRLSIVVLPFVNLSNDPEQGYFADGITSNLTTDVAHIGGSFVIAANTAFTYKGKDVDAREIGLELGVRYMLEGSVERSANQIRVNAQLIDAETGSHLWAEAFDRDRGELFAIEDEITARIARTLDLQLIQIEAQRAERRGTNADAMDYVMRGDALWLRRRVSKDNYRAMEEMLTRAVQLDEQLPAALTGLAGALVGRVLDGFSDAPADDLRRAEELVSRVLAANPNDAHAHHVKGQILRAQKRFEEAIAEYETEIALSAAAVGARNQLARAKILVGEPAEAIPLLEQAMRISPRDPDIGYMQWRLGLANLLLGKTDEAIRWTEKSVLTYYEPAYAYLDLAAALGLKGDKAAAQAALAEAIKRNPDLSTIATVRVQLLSDRPKFLALAEQTVIEGLRKAGLPE